MPVNKRQHFVSQFTIRAFMGDRDRLFCLDKSTLQVRDRTHGNRPEDILKEAYYYTTDEDDSIATTASIGTGGLATLQGGSLTGGIWDLSGGGEFQFSTNSMNRLANLTVTGGDLVLGASSSLQLAGTVSVTQPVVEPELGALRAQQHPGALVRGWISTFR